MEWVLVALLGYFLLAVVATLEKYLLHSRISKPSVFAFYVSIFSLFALFFIPFIEFSIPSPISLFIQFFSGLFFIYGLVALYKAVQENEISRVNPIFGITIPFFSALYSLFFLGDRFTIFQIIAVIFLIGGGFLISFDLPLKDFKVFKGFRYAILAGTLNSFSLLLLKEVFNGGGTFFESFVWNRISFFLAGMTILLIPRFRRQIRNSFSGARKEKKRATTTSIIFVINKVVAGIATLLLVRAVYLGPVAFVSSLVSLQFVFVFGLATAFSFRYHDIFHEKLEINDWVQKIASIFIIAIGLWMLYI